VLARPPAFNGTVYEPKPAAEIVLPTANGGQFKLSDYHGKVVLLFFGYTNCPDVCPTTMANLKLAVEQLGADASRVQVVFVTVDPARDNPEGTQRYATTFNPSFLGLSGTEAQLQPVWDGYGVYRELGPKDVNGNYPVTHSARITVIDSKGDLRLSYTYEDPWQDISDDLRLLLGQG
jgi:protein SCO1/2